MFQSTSSTRYADIHVQDLPLGVPNGVPKHVYFVYSWVSVWYTLLNILCDGLVIPYHVQVVELDSPSRPCPDHLVASKDPKYVAKPRALARVDIYKGDLV